MKCSKVLVSLMLCLAPGAFLDAQIFRWLAFGDSITNGDYDFDDKGGYPGRLHDLLNCGPSVCQVYNGGKSGEKTYEAVTRIDSVLNNQGPFDVMLLMEGTNDIFMNRSVESIKGNLATIASKARNHKVETVHSSIIWFHPAGEHGTTKNTAVKSLRDKLANLSQNNNRTFVDNWDELCPYVHADVHGHNQSTCFAQHYSDVCEGRPPPCGDNRGHPIGSGYNMMADRWYNSLKPSLKPAKPVLTSPMGEISLPSPFLVWQTASRATWYRLVLEDGSGDVIDQMLEASAVCSGGTCSYQSPVLASGDYTWKVRGRGPAGFGAWSNEVSVSVVFESFFGDGLETGDTSAWEKVVP